MSKFTDAKNREWILTLDPIVIDDVHKELSISLYTITDDKGVALTELYGNVPVFCNLVYIIVREQAQALGVDERGFMRGMAGDALEAMGQAFYQCLAEFAPKKKRELMMLGMKQMEQHQAALMPLAQKKLTNELQQKFGELSELLASTPEDSASDS